MISGHPFVADSGLAENLSIQWLRIPQLPFDSFSPWDKGVAGPVAGAHGDYLMVAGGSDFLDNPPWKGGIKRYHSQVYLLGFSGKERIAWKKIPEQLPLPMAYSACVSTAEGIISIGGETGQGPVSNVFLHAIQEGQLRTTPWPDIPESLTSPAATISGDSVYVAGGQNGQGASRLFACLSRKEPGKGWNILPPLPEPLSHAILANQWDGSENCLYLLGGRNKTSDVHTFSSSVWKYTPSAGKWDKAGDLTCDERPFPLSAGAGIARGNHQIVIIGGDPGIFFNKTERLNNRLAENLPDNQHKALLNEKYKLLAQHPGFSPAILLFDTLTGNCEKIGNIAGDSPVTTPAFMWHDTVIIPSGEIKPGARTPQVLAFRMNKNQRN